MSRTWVALMAGVVVCSGLLAGCGGPVSDTPSAITEKIAFVSDRDGNREICVMHADGSHERRLTNHAANQEHPTWSPDAGPRD